MDRQWRQTHVVDGEPVMVCPEDVLNHGDFEGDPGDWLFSMGAYTEEEWNSDGRWPRLRARPDGAFVFENAGEVERAYRVEGPALYYDPTHRNADGSGWLYRDENAGDWAAVEELVG